MRYEIPYSEVVRRLYALTALDRADNLMVSRGETPYVISPDTLPALEAVIPRTAAALILRLPGAVTASLADPIAFDTLGVADHAAMVLELAASAMALAVLAHVYRNDSPASASRYADDADAAVIALQRLLSDGLPTVAPHDL